jgi:hypothetical protein
MIPRAGIFHRARKLRTTNFPDPGVSHLGPARTREHKVVLMEEKEEYCRVETKKASDVCSTASACGKRDNTFRGCGDELGR